MLRAIEGGEEIEILRGPEVIARLVPARDRRRRQLGEDAGLFTIPDDEFVPYDVELRIARP